MQTDSDSYSRWTVEEVRARLVEAVVVSTPLLAFLAHYRLTADLRYVTYAIPVLGEMPKPVLFDLFLFAVATALWLAARLTFTTRMIFLALAIPIGAFVVFFRTVDHYYYASTRSSLNAYVLYSNRGMVQEGTGIVLRSPLCLVLALAVTAHYLCYWFVPSYRRLLAGIANNIAARRRLHAAPPLWVIGILLGMNELAVITSAHRRETLISFSGEYEFLSALPAFFRDAVHNSPAITSRPERMLLPERDTLPHAVRERSRPDVFLITVESFNSAYTLPAKVLNPGLQEDIMPYFRSLDSAGFMFTNAYTSSAYTFNAITGMLCSQYTVSETTWGRGCLPDVLGRASYDRYALISIQQLRPQRFDAFAAMGFERDHVFDATRMRRGQRNVYFSFMTDKEVFDFAQDVSDRVARSAPRRPLFMHIATNQMHVPGYFRNTTCKPYPFADTLKIDRRTRSMLNSARCTDRDLRAFLDHLRSADLYDDALIIVTADHAFNIAFWNVRENELAKVPLFIKFPRSAAPVHVDTAQVVAQVDIAPTILDYLGLEAERPMYGRSLLAPTNPSRSVLGLSSSRLLSSATRQGVTFHVHGQHDAPDALVERLDALYSTVLYFDQHPDEFVRSQMVPAAVISSTTRPKVRDLGSTKKTVAP